MTQPQAQPEDRRMKPLWRATPVAVGLVALTLNACALVGGTVSGRVIDASTGLPVPDAIVVVLWHGSWTKIFAESSSGCYHAETARTDADGRFTTPAWVRPFSATDLRLTPDYVGYAAYKPGYWRAENADLSEKPQKILIAPFKGTKAQYVQTVLWSGGWNCLQAGASSKNLYRLRKAIADEAKALAETPMDRQQAMRMLELADELLVNQDKPTDYTHGRLRNIDPRDTFKVEDLEPGAQEPLHPDKPTSKANAQAMQDNEDKIEVKAHKKKAGSASRQQSAPPQEPKQP